ncbi:MAG: ABC transporter substrate-binding protein [bacterium]
MRKSIVAVIAVLLAGVLCLLGAVPSLGAKYNESPMLKERVAAGKLPPVEERLPKVPFVVGPGVLLSKDEINFEVGRYGGILRTVRNNPGWNPDVFVMNNEPLVIGPGILGENVRGNVAEDFKVSENNRVFTFRIREGLKWSDGVPVTTEDVLFAYEDFLLNDKLTPVFPSWLRSGNRPDGEPVKVEVLDKYTFRMSFAEPYGAFLVQLAIGSWRGYNDLIKPKHYLKQFHPKYVPLEKLEPLIAKENLSKGEWWTLFNAKDHTNWELTRPTAIGFPVLYPWVMVESTPTTITYERNPYYFKVDTAGNQLPYIDGIKDTLVADVETMILKVLAGEVDFLYEAGALTTVPVYKENEKRGGYRTILLGSHTEPATIYLNLTYNDPVWRQVVRDVRFRRALNMGINRKEIIDAIWLGFGASLPELMPSKYDPVEANRLLDEMGLDKRDSEGWRLGPDGKTFVIPFEITARTPEMVPTAEMVVEYFKALGLKTTMKTIDSALRSTRSAANELKATVERNPQPLWWGRSAHAWYLPTEWGPLWNLWRTSGGKEGEEPPADVKRFMDLVERSMVVSPEERRKVIEEYERLQYENIYFIVPVEKEKRPIIASVKMENVAHSGFSIAACFAGEQFFFKE